MGVQDEKGFAPLLGGREGGRQRTLFVVGKLTGAGREHVCRVRNISDRGVGIEHDAPIAKDDCVTIELRGLPESLAVVRWVDAGMAGLEFAQPIAFQQIQPGTNNQVLRSPRFAMDRRVTVRIDDVRIDVGVHDIALGGLKVAAGNLEVGNAATIGLRGHEMLMNGRICWTSSATSGVQFNRPLATQDLIAILRAREE